MDESITINHDDRRCLRRIAGGRHNEGPVNEQPEGELALTPDARHDGVCVESSNPDSVAGRRQPTRDRGEGSFL
jgi:hypothetical protein